MNALGLGIPAGSGETVVVTIQGIISLKTKYLHLYMCRINKRILYYRFVDYLEFIWFLVKRQPSQRSIFQILTILLIL